VLPGDLAYNMMRAWHGAIGTVKNEGMVSPAYVTARPKVEMDSIFLNYALSTTSLIKQISNNSYGVMSFRKRLYWDSFKRINFLLPSLSTQRLTGSAIQEIDCKIVLHQNSLARLRQILVWAEQNVLPLTTEITPKVRVGGYTKPWRPVELGTLLSENETERLVKPERNQLLTVGLHMAGIRPSDARTLDLGATPYYVRHTGQLLYGKQNLFNGALGIVDSKYDGMATSKFVPGFDLDQDLIRPSFLLHYLGRSLFYQSMYKIALGNGSKLVNPALFYKVHIGLPSLEEQEVVDHLFLNLDKRIRSEEKLINHFQGVKRWALDNMFV
jgi:type I restriction enzyme S subunit